MAADTSNIDQYNGGDLLTIVIIFQILTWISVGLRTYVRTRLTKNFRTDDSLMLVAQVNFTLSSAFIALGLTDGLGHHNAVLPQWKEILAIKWQALATATYISNMMFIKLSIGVFLLRLATQRRYRWTIWASMGIIAGMSTALLLWDVLQCKPVAAQWDYTIPNYTCASTLQVVHVAYALSVLSILSDWLYALLPIPMLWKAKMTPQAKVTVSTVLGLGIFASVATLIRVRFLVDLTDASDILYAGTNPMVWTLVEPGVAIIAASLVTIRPLLRQMRLTGFDSTQRSRSRGFWVRYGRGGTGGGAGKLEDNNHSAKKGRVSRGIDLFERDDIKLHDLEAGLGASDVKSTLQNDEGLLRQETTLISQNSMRDEAQERRSAVRNFSTPLGIVVVREEAKEDLSDVANDADDGCPVAPWPLASARQGTPESELVVQAREHDDVPLRGYLRNGKIVWRSETPNSLEEAETIQGLREVPSRTGQDRSPCS